MSEQEMQQRQADFEQAKREAVKFFAKRTDATGARAKGGETWFSFNRGPLDADGKPTAEPINRFDEE